MRYNIIYLGVLAILVVLGLIFFFGGKNNDVNGVTNVTNTNDGLNASGSTGVVVPNDKLVDLKVNTQVAKNIGGWPLSWPSDVPKYPNVTVVEKGGNNPSSAPVESVIVFTTTDTVKTVVNFYLKGLIANGWTITEDGAGTANMTTFRAAKGKRSVGGYAVYENKKTEVTLGVNVGL